MKTVILRHKKENLKKCSLSGLEKREDICFYTYPKDKIDLPGKYILLKMGEKPLSEKDKDLGLLIIDGTWKYAKKMTDELPKYCDMTKIEYRSIPSTYTTAYPRKQTLCPDPEHGLASIEALYVAYLITKRPINGLLDNYYWKDKFLSSLKLADKGLQ
jgi:pre-rRNA-processing protein TSR3